jgi:hypothetical protein
MNNVVMIMNARNLSAFRDCINKLNVSKVWFKGFTEYELNTEINKFIQETNFDNYYIVSDDLVIQPEHFNLLQEKLKTHPIVTGWGVWRQNWDWTTIHFQDKLHTFNQGGHLPLMKKHYNVIKTYEIETLPDEFETAFTGWFWTGIRRDIWLEYPYQTMSTTGENDSVASTDAHWSKRILKDKKYKQMCFKEARVLHLSYMGKDYDDLNFENKQIIKEFI